ncbi:efflux RND transporter periplasmic adaptor subunit [Aliidiomarina sedimenti]|uniref:Efflux RND transporter periplasmic adaptor subunit n=1 Tax=Aliidiomarina sedimenti TaxID=1933879 RepID=A0ABY0BV62_9GAMM|nr:efflux RND transporter periplasmic adaptor subunit [Aliidiomarina sedimenti]RUO28146.1 efflux RND transporter periplasmic adaptor subunit [Aliidiomarina sedimenti]
MNKKNPVTVIAVIFVVIVLGATALGLSFQTPHQDDHDHSQETAASEYLHQHGEDQEQEYTCSMHPNFRSTDPNERCPICGMELIPVTTSAARDDDLTRIEFTGRSLALLDLQTYVVQRGSANAQLRMTGSLEFDERSLTAISAWTGGRIENLYVNFTGDYVEAGEPLVELYSPELYVAQQELLQAYNQAQRDAPGFLADSNQTTLRASRERLRLLGLTSAQIEKIIESGEASDRITIYAPTAGLVVTRNVSQGDYVNTGDTVLELADGDQLWAVFELFERDLQYIEVGQQLEFELRASNERIEGVVESLGPRIDAERRTREVRVAISGDEHSLTAGSFVRALVNVEVDEVMTIPASAPLLTGDRAVVYVRVSEDSSEFEARNVEIGRKLGDSYEVLNGLAEGDHVVSRGAFRIDSELQLRGRPSMMAPQGGGAGGHDHGSDQSAGSEQQATHEQHEESAVPAGENLQLGDLPQHYFAMWDALHNDDLEVWQSAATEFYQAADTIRWPHNMHDLHAELSTGAGHAQHVSSLEQARELFQTHSQAMIALAQADYLEVNAYLMFCPMAFDNQGAYWLQPDNRLLNPYFGGSMLRCGDRVESFEAGHDSHGGH